ncbi:hypothetical protein HPB48_018690 [Haemaphysalis longicornis]|uniref:Fibronectin type-III domain-containing protein n=1 Tax=Haemaphysalis longicornis TaxID=44386 RepID=A0A9J6FQZ2_HAELO|nr:hypothetical protein HPB48_018690 [Haemaphysalis longicornis]
MYFLTLFFQIGPEWLPSTILFLLKFFIRLSLKFLVHGMLQVTWLPATEGYPGTNFYVQYRRKGDETWETTMLEEYEDNTVVHGLEKAVYEFRVIAVDGKHEQPSKVLEVDTGGLG